MAFAAYLIDRLLNRGRRKRLSAMEDPHAALLSQLRSTAHGTQSDPIVQAFELQLVAGGKLEFVPQRLRKHNSAEPVDGQFGSHVYHYMLEFGNIKWNYKRSHGATHAVVAAGRRNAEREGWQS